MEKYDIKEIKYKIKDGGTFSSSYSGSISPKSPQSEYEAKKIAEEWLRKKYPKGTIIDLQIIFK